MTTVAPAAVVAVTLPSDRDWYVASSKASVALGTKIVAPGCKNDIDTWGAQNNSAELARRGAEAEGVAGKDAHPPSEKFGFLARRPKAGRWRRMQPAYKVSPCPLFYLGTDVNQELGQLVQHLAVKALVGLAGTCRELRTGLFSRTGILREGMIRELGNMTAAASLEAVVTQLRNSPNWSGHDLRPAHLRMIASLCLLELGDMSARFAILLRGETLGDNPGRWLPLNQLTGADRTQQINLQGHGVGPLAACLISVLLRFNASLTSLDLTYNKIRDDGATSLAGALRVNASLTELSLRNNDIGPAGGKAIGKALRVNASLTSIDVRHNDITGAAARELAEVVFGKPGLACVCHIPIKQLRADELTTLDLSHECVGVLGALLLAALLPVSASLTEVLSF